MEEKRFIVVIGGYPYRFWGPFDEAEADHWAEVMKPRGSAVKLELQPPEKPFIWSLRKQYWEFL